VVGGDENILIVVFVQGCFVICIESVKQLLHHVQWCVSGLRCASYSLPFVGEVLPIAPMSVVSLAGDTLTATLLSFTEAPNRSLC
jgi:hypothetical protein